MIILDDQSVLLAKSRDITSQTPENTSAAATLSHDAHPDGRRLPQHHSLSVYASAEHQPPPYTYIDEADPLLPYYFHGRLNKRARKRFIHALAFAAIFWTITGLFVRELLIIAIRIDKVPFCPAR